MRLLSLELHGFKSFPEKTKVNFDTGMTVIVGPNGSGKSNISDAVKWVLGEISAKNIRGAKLEDVIFGGTDRRSPMGFAEVSLTIDNSGDFRISSDYNEITVTRRYYRTGDSDYLINGKNVRLKDITELFMNTGIGKTGYSIIGQGKISEIISQKSEERRYIFEEAAGISKYRYKKQEAERKIVEIDSNLIRLSDIVSVLEERVGPLEKDAAKARIYLDLYEQKKKCDVSVAVYDISQIAKQTEIFERDWVMAKHSLDMAEDSLSSLETQSANVYKLIEENRILLEESRNSLLQETEARHAIESSLLVSQNEIEHNKQNMSRLEEELANRINEQENAANESEKLKSKLDLCVNKVAELRRDFDKSDEILSGAHSDVTGLEKEYNQLVADKTDCEKMHVDKRIRLSALESSQVSLEERKLSVNNEAEAARKVLAELNSKVEKSIAQLAEYSNKSIELEEQKGALVKQCAAITKQKDELLDRLAQVRVQKSTKLEQANTLRRMEEHFEGYQKSVRRILDAAANNELDGICGPISKIITVEQKYSVAIETALGNNIQNIVVKNEDCAKAAIRLLKQESVGRATFYPLTSVKADKLRVDLNKAATFKGYVGIASELVEYKQEYSEVIASLLGRTFVFDNLDNAGKMAAFFGFTVKIVTLDGQIINAGGSYTGGSIKHDSGILTRSSEIEALIVASKKLESEEDEISEETELLEAKLLEKNEALTGITDTYTLLATMYKGEETSCNMLKSQLEQQNSQYETLLASEKHLQNQDKVGEQLRDSLEKEIADLASSIVVIEAKIAMLSLNCSEAQKKYDKLAQEKNEQLIKITIAEKEVEAAQLAYENNSSIISMISEQIDKIQTEIASQKNGSNDITNSIEELNERIKQLDDHIAEINAAIRKRTEKSEEYDRDVAVMRDKVKVKTEERNKAFEHYTKLESKRNGINNERDKITERLWEDYELTFTAASELDYPAVTEENRSKTVSEQSKLRSKIKELGSVNVGAIDEYTQVKKDYDFMSSQIKDLTQSKDDYANIVVKLEREMCQKFSEAFGKINENFSIVFKSLFGGGHASLELSEPDNVLSSGIEITVAPPGKVIKNLKSLSGGEQVFVAIAILFAIFKVNPPPFCLLDEIESALDEVNVERFANYAKNYCDNTQFIIISHRRGTMEAASSLYGVTMQERGVSKLLSINVSEVEKKLGIKFNT